MTTGVQKLVVIMIAFGMIYDQKLGAMISQLYILENTNLVVSLDYA